MGWLAGKLPIENPCKHAAAEFPVGFIQTPDSLRALGQIRRLILPDHELRPLGRRQHRESMRFPGLNRAVGPANVTELGKEHPVIGNPLLAPKVVDLMQDGRPAGTKQSDSIARSLCWQISLSQGKIGVDPDQVQLLPEIDSKVLVEVGRIGQGPIVGLPNLVDQLDPARSENAGAG